MEVGAISGVTLFQTKIDAFESLSQRVEDC
jgi:hypothetical protein